MGEVPVKLEALFGSLKRNAVDRLLDQHGQVERMVLELELARLDLGEIKDVADDGEQRVGALADGLRVVALLGVQVGAEEKAGHADDGVHRRANLVAHVGEELGLGHVGAFRRFLRRDEFILDLLAVGDFLADAAVADDLAGEVEHRRAAGAEPDDAAVLRLGAELEIAEPLPLADGVKKLGRGDDRVLGQDIFEQAVPDQFLRLGAEQTLHAIGERR